MAMNGLFSGISTCRPKLDTVPPSRSKNSLTLTMVCSEYSIGLRRLSCNHSAIFPGLRRCKFAERVYGAELVEAHPLQACGGCHTHIFLLWIDLPIQQRLLICGKRGSAASSSKFVERQGASQLLIHGEAVIGVVEGILSLGMRAYAPLYYMDAGQ